MARLMQLIVALAAAFCVATLIAEAIIFGFVAVKWHLDRDKLAAMVAAAQGVLPTAPPVAKTAEEIDHGEQPSYEEILEARAGKLRNLELREQGLRNALAQLQLDQTKLAQDQSEFTKLRQSFTEQVAAAKKREVDVGQETVVRDLAAIKPKQAKELILLMMKRDESKQIVGLLLPMSDNRRAKIFAEFKTPEELEKADELMRLIRQGEPDADITEATQRQINSARPAPPQEIRR